MKHRGIPPSIDREGVRGELIVFALLSLLVIAGVYLFMTGESSEPLSSPEVQKNPEGMYQFDALMKERERAEAYQAVRDYMDTYARGPGVVGVYCRESSHRLNGLQMEFTGDVDLEYAEGRMERKKYTARLTQYGGVWTVTALDIVEEGGGSVRRNR